MEKQLLRKASTTDEGVWKIVQPAIDLIKLANSFGADEVLSDRANEVGCEVVKLDWGQQLFLIMMIFGHHVPRETHDVRCTEDRACINIIKKVAQLPDGHRMLLIHQLILLEYFKHTATPPEVSKDQP